MHPTDAELVRRVRAGDTDAFRLLVDRYHDDILRYATHLLGDAADAQDAVQETFVRAYRHLGSYREQDRFRPWLWRILVNRCRTLAAERARRPQPQAREQLALIADDTASPDAHLDRRALRDALASALQTLPPEQREAVLLHHAHGLSYPAISALTGAGVSALKMRVARACERLREMLALQHTSASTQSASAIYSTQSDSDA